MNIDRHFKAHQELYEHLANGEHEKAQASRRSTTSISPCSTWRRSSISRPCSWVFQESRLPKGELNFKGQPVDLKAIRKTALLTVEGERDDICALGQTAAAHDLCTGLRPHMKRHHMQAGVGHYGVFSGRKWDEQIYPIVRNLILASD